MQGCSNDGCQGCLRIQGKGVNYKQACIGRHQYCITINSALTCNISALCTSMQGLNLLVAYVQKVSQWCLQLRSHDLNASSKEDLLHLQQGTEQAPPPPAAAAVVIQPCLQIAFALLPYESPPRTTILRATDNGHSQCTGARWPCKGMKPTSQLRRFLPSPPTWAMVEAFSVLHEEVNQQEHEQEGADGQVGSSHQTESTLQPARVIQELLYRQSNKGVR